MKGYTMTRRLITALVCACAIGAIGASGAQASTEVFFNGNLGSTQEVSGTPHSTTFFVGAYSSFGSIYCVALQPTSNPNVVKYEVCGTGTGVTTSFPAQFGRGNLLNASTITGHFLAEARW
jgi:hypothetical protein